MWKQLGLIAFTRDALLEYTDLAPTPLEKIESVDMNRLLEHGRTIRMVETRHRTVAVDTPADLARVEALIADDPLLRSYSRSR
jgi:3-deoxy-manno-octulosonate cytidylyltransferase (CMP-KDO synthetase)